MDWLRLVVGTVSGDWLGFLVGTVSGDWLGFVVGTVSGDWRLMGTTHGSLDWHRLGRKGAASTDNFRMGGHRAGWNGIASIDKESRHRAVGGVRRMVWAGLHSTSNSLPKSELKGIT